MYIKKYEEACPICNGTVSGNFKYKYHCENCMLLFDYKDLVKKNKIVNHVMTDNPIIKKRIKNKTFKE
ncbi:hypothetical protein K9L97_01980 [Candidatus Woesearchaeota archaeon]|nr:hypothetical protein [Candidatus Woesearchaeota archaeon]